MNDHVFLRNFLCRAFCNFLFRYSMRSCFPSFVFPRISFSPHTPSRNIFFIRLLPEALRTKLQSRHVGNKLEILVGPLFLCATI